MHSDTNEKIYNLFQSSLNTTPNSASPISKSESVSSGSSVYAACVPSSAVPELQSQVTQLSDRVMRETKRRKSLEIAVKKLTEEK
jgi:signal-induced proliferation-associated 1 like protein 1